MPATKKTLDFTNVKEGGNFNPARVPEGDYVATVTAVDDHASKDSKVANNWVFTLKLKGRAQGTYPYYCGWDEKQLWKVRNLYTAATGREVPKKRVALDPNKIVGMEVGVAMVDDEYEGKEKSVISAVFAADEVAETAPPKKAATKTTRRKAAPEPEPEDDDDDVDDDDMEELDLEEV